MTDENFEEGKTMTTTPKTITSIEIGDGRLAVAISPQGEPQCRISLPSVELSGPLYEVLAAAAAVAGGAKLDGAVLFGGENHVLQNDGISQHDLPVLCELLETVRVPISRLGTEGRNGEQDNRCCGCFAGAYPDRSNLDKFVLVYATSTSVYGCGRRDECGCFASRISLSNPCWVEAIEGIPPLGTGILERTPPEHGVGSIGLDENRLAGVTGSMLGDDPLPSGCLSDETLAELRRVVQGPEVQDDISDHESEPAR